MLLASSTVTVITTAVIAIASVPVAVAVSVTVVRGSSNVTQYVHVMHSTHAGTDHDSTLH